MPTRSRNVRTKARQKRTMSLTKRALKSASFDANKHFSTVLMLLAQQGGEIIVSTENIQTVIPKLRTMTYAVENSDTGVRVFVVEKDATDTVPDIQNPLPPYKDPSDEVLSQDPVVVEAGTDASPVDPTIAAADPA